MSSIVLASLSGARTKARDSAKVQSLIQLRNALELYRASNGSYPQTNFGNGHAVNYQDENGVWQIGYFVSDSYGDNSFTTTLQPLISDGYISKVLNNLSTTVFYSSQPAGNCGGSTTPPYLLIFLHETNFNFPTWSLDPTNYYCVTTY